MANYSYLADGMKTSARHSDGSGLVYRGPFLYGRDAGGTLTFGSAAFAGGRITATGVHYHVTDHLGSVVAVVKGLDGSVVESGEYAAYGRRTEIVPAGTPTAATNRWHFSGKEDQGVDFDIPYTDFGARLYAPNLGRWITPDPESEKYYDFSPYAYCANDPVNMVDPDGEHIWGIDVDGNINMIDEDESQHILYAIDSDGNKTGAYLSLSSDDLFAELEKIFGEVKTDGEKNNLLSKASSTHVNDIFKLFVFSSENTNVEWVVHRKGDEYTIGTIHNAENSGNYQDYGLDAVDASVHSHPGTSRDGELESMGVPRGAYEGVDGDWKHVIRDVNNNGHITRHSYVYFPKSKNLYYVGYHGPQFIRKAYDYKSFYFGVLNKR